MNLSILGYRNRGGVLIRFVGAAVRKSIIYTYIMCIYIQMCIIYIYIAETCTAYTYIHIYIYIFIIIYIYMYIAILYIYKMSRQTCDTKA